MSVTPFFIATALSGPAAASGGAPDADAPFFVENRGQLCGEVATRCDDVAFYVVYPDTVIGFAPGTVRFNDIQWSRTGETPIQTGGVLFELAVGDGSVRPRASGRRASTGNWFRGADPAGWSVRVPHFDRIAYDEVLPGIDLVFFFDRTGAIKYEFHVAPGADPRGIEVVWRGLDAVRAGDEEVTLVTAHREIQDGSLAVYQDHPAGRVPIAASYRSLGERSYGFDLVGVDPSLPLVIDPVVTVGYATYWGAGGGTIRTVQIDDQGNTYVAGGAADASWPTTPGAYETVHRGNGWPDIHVAKFDASGSLLWSTLIGGDEEDYAYVSAVDAAGDVYVSGRGSVNFPTTPGAAQSVFGGGYDIGMIHSATDAVIVKLARTGDALHYSTYLGGNGNDNGRAIHLLPTGELLVGGGNSDSTDLPTTPGVIKPNLGGNRHGWVARVAADGGSFPFVTYFGPDDDGAGDETIRALGADSAGDVWIGGTTSGTDLVPTPDAWQPVRGADSEVYIAKISADATQIRFLSWLGGVGFDELETEGGSDVWGNFTVSGSTSSADFPTTPGAFQSVLRGGSDGWVARIRDDATLSFVTLYGGSTPGPESFFGPAVDPWGHVYVTGRFRSADLFTTPDAWQPAFGGVLDAVLVQFSQDGSQVEYATYVGGSDWEQGRYLAVAPDGTTVAVAGDMLSTDFPVVNAWQSTPGPTFLATFDLAQDPLQLTVPPMQAGQQVTLTATSAAGQEKIGFVFGDAVGQGPCPPPLDGRCLDVVSPTLIGIATANLSGTATLTRTLPSHVGGRTVVLQAAGLLTGVSNTVQATIAY